MLVTAIGGRNFTNADFHFVDCPVTVTALGPDYAYCTQTIGHNNCHIVKLKVRGRVI